MHTALNTQREGSLSLFHTHHVHMLVATSLKKKSLSIYLRDGIVRALTLPCTCRAYTVALQLGLSAEMVCDSAVHPPPILLLTTEPSFSAQQDKETRKSVRGRGGGDTVAPDNKKRRAFSGSRPDRSRLWPVAGNSGRVLEGEGGARPARAGSPMTPGSYS